MFAELKEMSEDTSINVCLEGLSQLQERQDVLLDENKGSERKLKPPPSDCLCYFLFLKLIGYIFDKIK